MKKLCAIIAALSAACIEADPLPSPGKDGDRAATGATGPQPKLHGDSIFASSSEALSESGPEDDVALVGLPGAAEDSDTDGAIFVQQSRKGKPVREALFPVAEDGAFAGTLKGYAEDEFRLTFRTNDFRFSEPLVIRIPAAKFLDAVVGASAPPTENAPSPEPDADDFRAGTTPRFTAGVPDAAGAVTVTGADLTPALEAIVSVPARASTARATVDNTGNFTARVRGQPGDALVVFTRDPASGHTSPAASLVVPSPP
jgi:hypothetical protein